MDVKNQKRMAARILKCGVEKVWIDPEELEEVSKAITKADVRRLIRRNIIGRRVSNSQSRGRARKIIGQKKLGRRRNRGSRKGKKLAATSKKREWIKTIRPIRKALKKMRESGQITKSQYRKLYLMAKGGRFKSKSHLNLYIKKDVENKK